MSTWRWYPVGGLVLAVGRSVLPASFVRELLYVAVALGAVAAIVAGIRMHRPTRLLPWVLLVIGVLSWTVGDVIWLTGDHVPRTESSPSVADASALVGYPALAGCLYQIARVRRDRDPAPMLNGLIGGAVFGLVLWVLFAEPALADGEGTTLGRVVAMAYLVGDALLLVQVVHLNAASAVRSRTVQLLTAAIGLTLVGDALSRAASSLAVHDVRVELFELVRLVAYVLMGAAALHGSMVRTTAQRPDTPRLEVFRAGQFTFLAFAVLLLPGMSIVETLRGREPPVLAISITGAVIIGLFSIQMTAMGWRMNDQTVRLARLADSDVLTGLANRRRFVELVAEQLDEPAPRLAPVLLVVLDGFGEVNETLGHRVGDELLHAAADRMVSVAGTRGVVARMGGETFAVLILEEGECYDEAMGCAARLRGALVEEFQLSDVAVSIDALVGVAVGPMDGTEVEELLQRADVALSVARERPDRVARYSGRMPSRGILTPHLMSQLSAAMEAGDVVVYYQPQVEVATGRVKAVEALVRWQHPVHGMLPPAAFIPAAERSGLVRSLTMHVLDRALAQSAEWHRTGLDLRVAVNLSVRNLLDPGFTDDVRSALSRYAIPPAALDLEITETMAMVDPKRSMEVMGALDAIGIMLSVDDYGTGHSSLAYLQRMPLTHLKIDRSFVMGMVDDPASAAIVRSTIDLARHLGMTVIAEGVEDDATLMALREMHCAAAQGFGLGRPVPGEAVPELVSVIEHQVPQVLLQRVPAGRRVV